MKKLLFLVFGFLIITSGMSFAQAASVETKLSTVSIWDLIIFRGEGFHRLHNVEITISQDDVVISTVWSQTTDRGDLFMPYITNLSPGVYDVTATDKIHTATTSFEI